MARNVYFIDEEFLKESSTISLNVDSSLLNIAILDAQDIKVQPLLGTNLYKKIISLLPDEISDAGNEYYYELFYDFIVPLTVQWSLVECILNIRYKITNKSISEQNSDNSNPADLMDVKFLRENIMNKAEFYGERMIQFLIEHKAEFSEYTDCDADEGMLPSTSSYYSGMFLD